MADMENKRAISRLNKEWKEMRESQPELLTSFSAGPIDEEVSLFEWQAVICGPDDSLYQGGIFNLSITFPKDYPFTPPEVKFLTKVRMLFTSSFSTCSNRIHFVQIYHPNVGPETGSICLDILKKAKWSSALTILSVLLSIISLLTDPNPESALNTDASALYKTNNAEYRKQVKRMVRLHAQ